MSAPETAHVSTDVVSDVVVVGAGTSRGFGAAVYSQPRALGCLDRRGSPHDLGPLWIQGTVEVLLRPWAVLGVPVPHPLLAPALLSG